jgi:hypothetical protein
MDREHDFYQEAHLFVAAVRILAYQRKNTPPAVEDICRLLSFSTEWGAMMCRRLEKLGVVDTITDSFQTRVFVADHRRLEEIPRQEQEASANFGRDLDKFREKKKSLTGKVEAIQAELTKKKKDLFADLEKKLKEQQKEPL